MVYNIHDLLRRAALIPTFIISLETNIQDHYLPKTDSNMNSSDYMVKDKKKFGISTKNLKYAKFSKVVFKKCRDKHEKQNGLLNFKTFQNSFIYYHILLHSLLKFDFSYTISHYLAKINNGS